MIHRRRSSCQDRSNRRLAPVGPFGARPALLVLVAIGTVQVGFALAKSLFGEFPPDAIALARVTFSALALGLLLRPDYRQLRYRFPLLAGFGVALAGLNLSFYAAISHAPLGIAMTLAFAGPLGLAVVGSRRALDLAWVAAGAAGVGLLVGGPSPPKLSGVLLGLLAGCFWAAYIFFSARVGREFAGGDGLALALVVAALVVLPFGAVSGGVTLVDPRFLALGLAVSVLSSMIPSSLELEALRHIPTHVFGVFMSLEPAVAALFGRIVLGERLAGRALGGIALVVAASAGISWFGRTPIAVTNAETPVGR
jgi:inner membrane transporter RhtA